MTTLIYILFLSALLPYLPGGVRAEHILIFASFPFALISSRRFSTEIIFISGGLLLGSITAAYFSRYSWQTGVFATPVSQFIRLLLPAITVMVISKVLPQREGIVMASTDAALVLGALTAAFTVSTLLSDSMLDLLQFWTKGGAESVWQSSIDVGRYTGIFNQPIEAGIFYSICFICALHSFYYGKLNRAIIFPAMSLIFLGGSLSLSKNFLVVGVFCGLLYCYLIGLFSKYFIAIAGVLFLISSIAIIEIFNVNYFNSLLDLYLDEGLLGMLSAGRFGVQGSGSVSILFESLFKSGDWLTGRGLGSQLPLDNGYLEYLYQGGILSLIGFAIFLFFLSWHAWLNRSHRDGKLLLVVVVYVWLSSLGGPTITANRAGTCILILITGCLVSIRRSQIDVKRQTGLLNSSLSPMPLQR